jgi:uncharacterized protein (TIGR03067 family)
MRHRLNNVVAIALWIAPLVLGMTIAAWIVVPSTPRQRKQEFAGKRGHDDLNRLQGPWVGVSRERDGKEVYRGLGARRATVKFFGQIAVFEEAGASLTGNFGLDETRTPKTFDLTVAEGNTEKTYPAGIYQLDADTFRLCFAFPVKERPTEFVTYPGSGRTLFVYRRGSPKGVLEPELANDSWLNASTGGLNRNRSFRQGRATYAATTIGPRTVSPSASLFFGITIAAPLLLPTGAGLGESQLSVRKSWNFEADEPGKIPNGFSNEVGKWVVAKDGDNHVLAQRAKNDDATFNVVLAEGANYKDLDLSVRMRAVEGETDRGGGLVWRAKDARNYYICRYNPLRGASYRVYKVVDGKRTQFQALILPEDLEWHTLRVTMTGNHITCYFDGKKSLDLRIRLSPKREKSACGRSRTLDHTLMI